MTTPTVHLLGTAGYHPNDARQTSCIAIPELGIVLDAGTGMYRLRDLLRQGSLHIFLSHAHLDHVCGLTFLLDVLWERPVDEVRVHGRIRDLDAVRDQLFSEPLFPVPWGYETAPLVDPVTLGEWTMHWREQAHPGGSVGFRLEGPGGSLAYVTDTTANPDDAASVAFVAGCDLLLHECNFSDGYQILADKSGHSTATAVGRLAARAGVRRLVLTHVNPLADTAELDRILSQARASFPSTELAHDGMALSIRS